LGEGSFAGKLIGRQRIAQRAVYIVLLRISRYLCGRWLAQRLLPLALGARSVLIV
jgi:hypothetical protein